MALTQEQISAAKALNTSRITPEMRASAEALRKPKGDRLSDMLKADTNPIGVSSEGKSTGIEPVSKARLASTMLKNKGVPQEGVIDKFIGVRNEFRKDVFETGKSIATNVFGRGEKMGSEMFDAAQGDKLEASALGAAPTAVIGSVGDIIGGLVIGSGKILLPQTVEDSIAEKVGELGQDVMASDVAQKVAAEWNKLPPETQEVLIQAGTVGEVLLDTIGLGAGARATKAAVGAAGDVANIAGEALESSAKKSFREQAASIITQNLDDAGIKGRKEALRQGNVVEGGMTRTAINSDADALDIAAKLVEDGKLRPEQSTIKQNQVYTEEIGVEANKLRTALANEGAGYDKVEFNSFLDNSMKELADSPTIVGDAEKSAQKIIKGFDKIMESKDGKVVSLLDARQEFDKWLLDNGVNLDKLSDTGKANNLAVKKIRNSINDFIDQKSQSIGVKESLSKQAAMYRTQAIIQDKFAREATGILGRVLQKLQNVAGIPKSEIIETLGFIGLGAAGAGVAGAPMALGLGAGLVGKKIAKGIPRLKQRLGKALKGQPEKLKQINQDLDDLDNLINPKEPPTAPTGQAPKVTGNTAQELPQKSSTTESSQSIVPETPLKTKEVLPEETLKANSTTPKTSGKIEGMKNFDNFQDFIDSEYPDGLPIMERAKIQKQWEGTQLKNSDKNYSDSVKPFEEVLGSALNSFSSRSNKAINKKLYRGEGASGGTGGRDYGEGLYFSTDKKIASQYGELKEIPKDMIPKNPLRFDSPTMYEGFLGTIKKRLGVRYPEAEFGDIGKLLRSLGDYDGVIVGDGEIVVNFGKNTEKTDLSKYLNKN